MESKEYVPQIDDGFDSEYDTFDETPSAEKKRIGNLSSLGNKCFDAPFVADINAHVNREASKRLAQDSSIFSMCELSIPKTAEHKFPTCIRAKASGTKLNATVSVSTRNFRL